MIIIVAVLLPSIAATNGSFTPPWTSRPGLTGWIESHATMDVTSPGSGGVIERLMSLDRCTSVALIFVIESAAVVRDIVIGLLDRGSSRLAWFPDTFWRSFFLVRHPTLASL